MLCAAAFSLELPARQCNATLLQLVLSLLRLVLSLCYALLQLFDESIQLSNALPCDAQHGAVYALFAALTLQLSYALLQLLD